VLIAARQQRNCYIAVGITKTISWS
jgi:hypothetical protein